MNNPKYGSVEFDLLCQAQMQICFVYIHMLRAARSSHRYFELARTSETSWATVDQGRVLSVLQHSDEEAALVAANRLDRYLKALAKLNVIPKEFACSLQSLSEKIKEVRDIREHFEEYLSGKGRNKVAFWHIFRSEEGWEIPMHAGGSLQVGSERYFGGRIKATDLGRAVREAYQEFSNLDLWMLPWTPRDVANATDGEEAMAGQVPVPEASGSAQQEQ